MQFQNFTPHTINMNDGRSFESVGLARVSASFTEPNEFGIVTQTFGEITDLPEPQEGVMLIVSGLVLSAALAVGRTDCVAPATGHPDAKRNEKGHIVSVPFFVG